MAFPTNWGRKCSITIDYTKVGASLTDFPVLITKDMLPSEMFDADGSNPALNGGGDIRFSSDAAGTTQLACEIVSFVTDNNPANGSAEIWVKVPSLSSSTNTVIYVWYKKSGESQPAVTDTYGRNNVWDSNFVLVSHNAGLNDSTSNGNNGTDDGTSASTGKIGAARNFNDATDSININDANSLDVAGANASFTLQAWAKSELNATLKRIVTKRNTSDVRSFELFWSSAEMFRFQLYDGGSKNPTVDSSTGLKTSLANTWISFAGVRDVSNSKMRLYINGAEDSAAASDVWFDTNFNGSGGLMVVGNFYDGGNAAWVGDIDEVRLSKIVRSATWLSTEYNNQNSPSTFATAGTPESMITSVSNPALLLSLIS